MTTKTNAMPKATLSTAKLLAVVESVCADSKSLQSRIHDAAVEIMLHAFHHEDFSMANTLVNGLGTGIRAKALVDWFVAAGLKVNEKDRAFVGMNAAKIEDKFQKMKAKPWFELKVENPFEGFDIDAEISRLIKKARKAIEKDAAAPDADKLKEGYKMNVTPEHIKMLEAMKSNPQAMTTVQ